MYDDIEQVNMFLCDGYDVNQVNEKGSTALIWAAINGNVGILLLLLAYDADPNIINNSGYIAVVLATKNHHKKIVSILIQNESLLNFRYDENYLLSSMNSDVFSDPDVQESILTSQPQYTKTLINNIGVCPEMSEKYKDYLGMIEMGIL